MPPQKIISPLALPVAPPPIAPPPIAPPPIAPPPVASPSTTQNGNRTDRNGFIYVTVKGKPEERGYAQGFLIADRIVKFIRTYAFFLWSEHGRDITFFTKMIKDLFGNIVDSQEYHEYYLEMKGIARGVVDKISTFSSQQEKDAYFTKGAIDGIKIVLPADSHLEHRNLVYNGASEEEKKKYTKDGKILIDINFDIIFLLNCVVTVDYAYSKLAEIFSSNNSFKQTASYKEYVGNVNPLHSHSSIGKSSGVLSSIVNKKGASEGGSDRCSAFMAVGNTHTSDGGIICAHITFDNYIMGQFDNIILYIDTSTSNTPQKPSYNILMQTFAGGVFSSTDFFVTSAKIVGTETTIGGFHAFELHAPACVRSRKAMQYSGTLDEYIINLRKNNSGDYANTWYIGHTESKDSAGIKRPEIMRIELGLKYVNVEKKTDGYFIGFNACYDPRIRNLECSNDGFFDIRRHSGARRVTLNEKIKEYTEGTKRISIAEAQSIISNHYDLYLGKDNPCSRSICAHYDLDKREYMSQENRPKPYQPKGAVDAKICSSSLCNKMQFMARWGNACGTDFRKDDFCNLRREWEYQRAYMEDRLKQPWVVCTEVNIATSGYDMNSAIKEYVSGSSSSSASMSPSMSTSIPNLNPVALALAPSASASPSSQKNIPNITPDPIQMLPPNNFKAAAAVAAGGSPHEFDNNKELKDFIKMFKKQNKKSYRSKNSNTRRNKKNDKKNDKNKE